MPTYFTTKEEMVLLLGQKGVQLRLDDQQTTLPAVEQALRYATQTIRTYTDQYYLPANLETNAWVNSIAVVLAVNYLSARRGNKELYGDQAAKIMQWLESIGHGFWIPDAIPLATNVPSVRTQKVVATGGPRPLKVDMHNSTGGGYSDEDFGPPYTEGPYGY